MANTNVQAIVFSNGNIRPMADLIMSAYLSAKKLVEIWDAQSVSTVIPNDSTIIADGAANDGRAQITDAQATAIVTRCEELISWLENGLIASPFNTGTASLSTLGTVASVQVNGQTKF